MSLLQDHKRTINNFEPQCKGDMEIMQVLVRRGFATSELQCLNHYRMWLKVTYLSDICTRTGNQISQTGFGGT